MIATFDKNHGIHRSFWKYIIGESSAEAAKRLKKQAAERTKQEKEFAKDGRNYRVFFENNLIYEYEDRKRKQKLTFPKSSRNYYKVGDFILYNRLDYRSLLRVFPELNERASRDKSWLSYLGDLFGEDKEYIVAYKIKSISTEKNEGYTGRGGMTGTGVIIFKDMMLDMKQLRTWDRDQLAVDFNFADTSKSLRLLNPIIEGVANLAEIAITGELKSIGKSIGQKLLKEGTRRALKTICEKLVVKLIGKGLEGFGKSFVEEIGKQAKEAEMRSLLDGKARQVSVTDALKDAIPNGIKASLNTSIEEYIDSINKIDPILGATMEKRLEIYLTKQFTQILTVEKLSFIEQSVRESSSQGKANKKRLDQVLHKNLQKEFDKWKSKGWKDHVNKLMETMTNMEGHGS
ncbi:MAG: hypothetical protein DYG89_17960 [Caldilinea sp. CFX5]|nr:hypothetical protein [Caldilinea sp. CFX5]